MLLFAGREIYKFGTPSNEYGKVAADNVSNLISTAFGTAALFVFSSFVVTVGPTYVFIINGEFSTFTGGLIPFTSIDTWHGYATNVILQTIVGCVACVGTIAIELVSCMINNTSAIMTDLTCYSMRIFSKNLNMAAFTEQNQAEHRDVLIRLQDVERYIAILNDIYFWKLLLQPILAVVCISLAIYGQLEVHIASFSIRCS